MNILILAGGGGTRLWPMSTLNLPKQFLKLGSVQSLLQRTILRFINSPNIHKILISTNEQYLELVRLQIKEIDPEEKCDIIVEPVRRNTGPAIAFAVSYIENNYANEDDLVLVLPSDHLIEPEATFLVYLDKLKKVATENKMILFGIRPNRSETGYGYIEVGEKIDSISYKIKKFIEKPEIQDAEDYAKLPQYYWNSGMLLFSIHTFWTQLKQHAPDIYDVLKNSNFDYSNFKDISIDYALMEKTNDILVCPLPVQWSDIGSWDSVYESLDQDSDKNVFIGNIHSVNTQRCLIIGDKRLITTIGLEDLLIIEKEDVILICKRRESQKVKAMVQKLLSL